MLKILCANCFGLCLAILAQFSVKMRVAAQNCAKKSLKTSFGKVQGHSKSSML